MKNLCYLCGSAVIWGGDHDVDADSWFEDGEFIIESNLHCPSCGAFYLMYHPKPEEDEKDDSQRPEGTTT